MEVEQHSGLPPVRSTLCRTVIAGLAALLWKTGLGQVYGNFNFERVPTISRTGKSGILYWLSVQIIWLVLITCFPSESVGFWHMPSRGCPCDEPLTNPLGAGATFHTRPTFCGGNEAHSVWRHWESTLGGLQLVSLDFTPCALFLADCALYPFAIINPSHKYDYMPSLEPSWQTSKLEVVVLGTLTHTTLVIIVKNGSIYC